MSQRATQCGAYLNRWCFVTFVADATLSDQGAFLYDIHENSRFSIGQFFGVNLKVTKNPLASTIEWDSSQGPD